MLLKDDAYLEHFKSRDLGPEYFDHRGHLYMAWLHIAHLGLKQASVCVCEGIRDLANKFDAPEKFNYTLSAALMQIIAGRMVGEASNCFDSFLAMNPDLVNDARGVIARHFSDELLDSDIARESWVEPDLEPIA